MKKMIALLLSAIFVLGLCACGAQNLEVTEPAPVETEAPTEAPAPTETVPENLIDDEEFRTLTSYFVTVLDENANPVVGAVVRLGDNEETCLTDETGVAQFSMPAGAYVVSIEELPMGYDFANDYREFSFEGDDVTLVIQVLQTFSEPEDMGMEDGGMPIEEAPEEEYIPEG